MKHFLFVIMLGILPSLVNANQLGDKYKLDSKFLGEEREIIISLPPIYDQEPFYKFPVLYLTDAYSQFDHTASMIHYYSGAFSPMIVVGIYTPDRFGELKPYTRNKQLNHRSEKLRSFIVEEVKPFVENKFRTESYSIFAGHSFGGSFASSAYLQGPDDFDVFLAFAPNFAMGNEAMFELMPAMFEREKQPKVYFQFEQETPFTTPIKSYHKLSSMLVEHPNLKTSHKVELFADEDHMTVPHIGLIKALKEIYRDWFLYIQPVLADKHAFQQHYDKLSERIGYQVKPTEYNLWEFVTALLQQKHIEQAKHISRIAADIYPKSHFSYSLLADVARAQNDKKAELAHLQQAMKLSEHDKKRQDRYKEKLLKLKG